LDLSGSFLNAVQEKPHDPSVVQPSRTTGWVPSTSPRVWAQCCESPAERLASGLWVCVLDEEVQLCVCRAGAGIPHRVAVGVSHWQKRSAQRQPRPIPQAGAAVFEALSVALLGLEGKSLLWKQLQMKT